MHKLRILAIDDDPLQRELLRSQLEELDHLVIDVVRKPEEFKRLIAAAVPELLIIDIDLKLEITGIDLAEQILETHQIPIIFLSGIKRTEQIKAAISNAPVAFITKPYDELSLFAALELASKSMNKSQKDQYKPFLQFNPEGLFIKKGHYLIRILFDELLWLEVLEKECTLHCQSEDHVIKTRLKDLMTELPENFVQIHRSYAINLKYLRQVDTKNLKVEIAGRKIPFSRNYGNHLINSLKMK